LINLLGLPAGFLIQITGYGLGNILGGVEFLEKFKLETPLDLGAAYPIVDGSNLTLESYSKIFHQSYPTQTQEEMVNQLTAKMIGKALEFMVMGNIFLL